MTKTVVCMGDSITRGQVSANYVAVLENRMASEGFRFVNAGVNNDLTYNLLRRLERVIQLQPDFVTILAGTNDLIGSSAWHRSLFYMLIKRLPRRPSLGWARQNMHSILTELKNRTQAIIGVASIPPLGEDLNSSNVARVRAYNGMLKRIAKRQKVAYLPVFERMEAYLKAVDRPGHIRRYRGSLVIEAEFVYRRLIVGQDYDEFSASKGFVILNDGVHLNKRGAALVADEIETFLRANTTATSSQNETKKYTQPVFQETDQTPVRKIFDA